MTSASWAKRSVETRFGWLSRLNILYQPSGIRGVCSRDCVVSASMGHHQSLVFFGICSEVLVAERLESM